MCTDKCCPEEEKHHGGLNDCGCVAETEASWVARCPYCKRADPHICGYGAWEVYDFDVDRKQ